MKKALFLITLFTSLCCYAQPDSAYRLIAGSRYNFTNSMGANYLSDTITLSYIGQNHVDFLNSTRQNNEWASNEHDYVELDPSTGMPVNLDKEVKTYDTSGSYIIISTMYLSKSASAATWDTTTKSIDSFENGYIIAKEDAYMQNGVWKNNSRYIYTNNTNGKVLEEIQLRWDDVNNVWKNYRRIIYQYTGAELSSKAEYSWNTNMTQWDSLRRNTLVYQSGNLIIDSIEQYNSNSKKWNNSQKYVYTYDNNGNRDTVRQYKWLFNTTPPGWNQESDEFMVYDNNGMVTVHQTAYLSGQSIVNNRRIELTYFSDTLQKRAVIYDWNISTQKFERDDSINYYYEKIDITSSNTAIEAEPNLEQVSVYPVPANGVLFVKNEYKKYADYIISSTTGQVLMRGKLNVNGTTHLDISSLTNGLYILNIQNKDAKISKRIVVLE